MAVEFKQEPAAAPENAAEAPEANLANARGPVSQMRHVDFLNQLRFHPTTVPRKYDRENVDTRVNEICDNIMENPEITIEQSTRQLTSLFVGMEKEVQRCFANILRSGSIRLSQQSGFKTTNTLSLQAIDLGLERLFSQPGNLNIASNHDVFDHQFDTYDTPLPDELANGFKERLLDLFHANKNYVITTRNTSYLGFTTMTQEHLSQLYFANNYLKLQANFLETLGIAFLMDW